ncbi:hypothetical protein WKW80_29315 [Variovorax humicola]|uniref:Uncharacterized protein n=1 Tax=Variovorax humicola TaxID=1769758 RepID=A0ABU8W7Q8_9BURK
MLAGRCKVRRRAAAGTHDFACLEQLATPAEIGDEGAQDFQRAAEGQPAVAFRHHAAIHAETHRQRAQVELAPAPARRAVHPSASQREVGERGRRRRRAPPGQPAVGDLQGRQHRLDRVDQLIHRRRLRRAADVLAETHADLGFDDADDHPVASQRRGACPAQCREDRTTQRPCEAECRDRLRRAAELGAGHRAADQRQHALDMLVLQQVRLGGIHRIEARGQLCGRGLLPRLQHGIEKASCLFRTHAITSAPG